MHVKGLSDKELTPMALQFNQYPWVTLKTRSVFHTVDWHAMNSHVAAAVGVCGGVLDVSRADDKEICGFKV